MNLKFYKGPTKPTNISTGSIWFNTSKKRIELITSGTTSEIYGGEINTVSYNNNILEINKIDGSSVTVDVSSLTSIPEIENSLASKLNKIKINGTEYNSVNLNFKSGNGVKLAAGSDTIGPFISISSFPFTDTEITEGVISAEHLPSSSSSSPRIIEISNLYELKSLVTYDELITNFNNPVTYILWKSTYSSSQKAFLYILNSYTVYNNSGRTTAYFSNLYNPSGEGIYIIFQGGSSSWTVSSASTYLSDMVTSIGGSSGQIELNTGLSIDSSGLSITPATNYTIGGVKPGTGLEVESDGTLNCTAEEYTLPIATSSGLGGIKVGSDLIIDSYGVLSFDSSKLDAYATKTDVEDTYVTKDSYNTNNTTINTSIKNLNDDIQIASLHISSIHSDIKNINTSITGINSDIDDINSDITSINTNLWSYAKKSDIPSALPNPGQLTIKQQDGNITSSETTYTGSDDVSITFNYETWTFELTDGSVSKKVCINK